MEVLQRTANRGSISTGSYEIPGSIKFEENNTEGMYAQPTAAGNRRTWTVSAWFKRSEISRASTYMPIVQAQVGSETGSIYILATDKIIVDVGYGGTRNRMQTKAVYRDTSAWYHIVWRVDTTQGTAANRNRVYINGVLQELDTIDGYPDQNFESFFNNNIPIYVGTYGTTNNYGYCGYMAEIQMTDGVSNAPTEFGEFDEDSGIWKPIEYKGSYGAQGFYLPFDDVSAIGKNGHGNDVNFTLQNISAADYSTDTPTNNFCTMNMLDRTNGNSKNQEGATKVTTDGGSGWCTMMATMGVTRGKWYWEYFKTSNGGANIYFGIAASDDPYIPYSSAAQYYIGNVAEQASIGFQVSNNSIKNSNNSSAFALLSGEVLKVALDMDNGALYFGKSTSTWASSGDPTSGASKTGASSLWASFDNKIVLPGISIYQGGNAQANFGGYASNAISSPQSDANGYGTFEYAPPSGYYALCTKNLAEYG